MIDLSGLLSKGSAEPIYLQIVSALRRQISDGSLAIGTRLPSSRALAQDLGVARSTVVTAYEQLVAEGFAEARRGAGIFVCDVAPIRPPEAPPRPQPAAVPPAPGMLQPGAPDLRCFRPGPGRAVFHVWHGWTRSA